MYYQDKRKTISTCALVSSNKRIAEKENIVVALLRMMLNFPT